MKMKKYTLGEILSTRKIGNIGKHSTLQDVINEFGVPGFIRWDGLVYYGNLIFEVSKVKKRIKSIIICYFYGVKAKDLKYFGENHIIKDFNKIKKMSFDDLKNYLKEYNIEIYTNDIIHGGNADDLKRFIPIDNKYYSIKDPKFKILYDFEENYLREIEISFNYRSKRRK